MTPFGKLMVCTPTQQTYFVQNLNHCLIYSILLYVLPYQTITILIHFFILESFKKNISDTILLLIHLNYKTIQLTYKPSTQKHMYCQHTIVNITQHTAHKAHIHTFVVHIPKTHTTTLVLKYYIESISERHQNLITTFNMYCQHTTLRMKADTDILLSQTTHSYICGTHTKNTHNDFTMKILH